ncbi:MAG: TRAP transporter small permease [Paracoccaceae bacterium]|nr:TRAP transporter small permease [Paracoccaceae bacterium]MDG2259584.1 TRAP transporter small permease [Paracoccaceae bacterium]
MQTIGRAISKVVSGTNAVASVLVVGLVLHVTLDVFMRYVVGVPLNSTILFVSTYYMIAIAFLPLALVEETDSHIAVEILAERFPDRVQTVLLVVATVLTAIVTAALAVRTGQEAMTKYNAGAFSIEPSGKVIVWPSYFFLPIGFGMMSVVAAWKTIAIFAGKDSGFQAFAVEDPYLTGDPKP